MEQKLAKMFDYQKYENNSRLGKVIRSVENKYPSDLQPMSEEELGRLSAAGNVDVSSLRQLKHDRQ